MNPTPPDYVCDLNNLLQNSGTLRHFSWILREEGPDHQKTHYATAKLHGQIIGPGLGISRGNAKREAAIQALEYLAPPS